MEFLILLLVVVLTIAVGICLLYIVHTRLLREHSAIGCLISIPIGIFFLYFSIGFNPVFLLLPVYIAGIVFSIGLWP